MPETGRRLKVGILLPEGEGRMSGATATWGDLVSLARLAEDVGIDSLWIPDHLLYRTEGETSRGTAESCTLLAALAAVTNRIELGSFVTCTSFRNPALLAKIADTIDEISDGRLILGLGAGWHEPEYLAYGYPFDHRVSRFEEALVIISGLLRDGHIDFEGQYYQARDCELRPRGPRPNGPPIMIGTTGKRMLCADRAICGPLEHLLLGDGEPCRANTRVSGHRRCRVRRGRARPSDLGAHRGGVAARDP